MPSIASIDSALGATSPRYSATSPEPLLSPPDVGRISCENRTNPNNDDDRISVGEKKKSKISVTVEIKPNATRDAVSKVTVAKNEVGKSEISDDQVESTVISANAQTDSSELLPTTKEPHKIVDCNSSKTVTKDKKPLLKSKSSKFALFKQDEAEKDDEIAVIVGNEIRNKNPTTTAQDKVDDVKTEKRAHKKRSKDESDSSRRKEKTEEKDRNKRKEKLRKDDSSGALKKKHTTDDKRNENGKEATEKRRKSRHSDGARVRKNKDEKAKKTDEAVGESYKKEVKVELKDGVVDNERKEGQKSHRKKTDGDNMDSKEDRHKNEKSSNKTRKQRHKDESQENKEESKSILKTKSSRYSLFNTDEQGPEEEEPKLNVDRDSEKPKLNADKDSDKPEAASSQDNKDYAPITENMTIDAEGMDCNSDSKSKQGSKIVEATSVTMEPLTVPQANEHKVVSANDSKLEDKVDDRNPVKVINDVDTVEPVKHRVEKIAISPGSYLILIN